MGIKSSAKESNRTLLNCFSPKRCRFIKNTDWLRMSGASKSLIPKNRMISWKSTKPLVPTRNPRHPLLTHIEPAQNHRHISHALMKFVGRQREHPPLVPTLVWHGKRPQSRTVSWSKAYSILRSWIELWHQVSPFRFSFVVCFCVLIGQLVIQVLNQTPETKRDSNLSTSPWQIFLYCGVWFDLFFALVEAQSFCFRSYGGGLLARCFTEESRGYQAICWPVCSMPDPDQRLCMLEILLILLQVFAGWAKLRWWLLHVWANFSRWSTDVFRMAGFKAQWWRHFYGLPLRNYTSHVNEGSV